MKKHLSLLILLAAATAAFGQDVAASAAPAPNEKAGELADIMAQVLLIGAAALFVVAMAYVIKVNQFLYRRVVNMEAAARGVALPSDAPLPEGDSFWETLRKKYWEDAVPVEREHEILSHHGFDGIHELDNSLPPWWVNMFIITVIWGAGYMWYYHFGGGGPSSGDEYKMEVEAAKKEIALALAGKADAVDESNVAALTDAGALGEGELIFKNSCAACHGQKGEGTVGPNLTDEYWLHGGGIQNVFKTIKNGVPDKGMIAWSAQLRPSDIQKVSSYILTLKGTNPPNPKAPQGDVWKEESGAPTAPADTTAAAAQPASK